MTDFDAISARFVNPTTVRSPACAQPELHSMQQQVRAALRLRSPSGCTFASHLLLNWARGFPALRGVSLTKRIHNRISPEISDTFDNALTVAAAMLKELVANDAADEAFAVWSNRARFELERAYFEQLAALPADDTRQVWVKPLMQSVLRLLMARTPHGSSRGPRNSVKAHGLDTALFFEAILCELAGRTAIRSTSRFDLRALEQARSQLRLPDWARGDAFRHLVLNDALFNAGAESPVWAYLINHDIGKPLVVEWDALGRIHFPDHAKKSAETWAIAGGDPKAVELMAKDMVLHTLKAEGVPAFAKDPDAVVLLMAALAEIHANAEPVFGGFESASFKAKRKQLDRRGAALLKLLGPATAA